MSAIAERHLSGLYRISCKTCRKILEDNVKSPAWSVSLATKHEKEECPATLNPGFWVFDSPATREFTSERMLFIRRWLRAWQNSHGIESALDIACGLGDFSGYLSELGIRVLGVDGRPENLFEARGRHPGVQFQIADAEELNVGTFDLVLCFGLLYHLKNPFRVIEKLTAATNKILLLESICFPGPPKLELFDELRLADQGLGYIAFYPSESALVKMLMHAGFPFVYGFEKLPDHPMYVSNRWRKRMRTMLVASKVELTGLVPRRNTERPPPSTPNTDLWLTPLGRLKNAVKRLISLEFNAPR